MSEIDEYTISNNASIFEAIEKININGKRFIVVIDKNKKITGLATDGDIRRALLEEISIYDLITKAMNTNYMFLPHDSSASEINNFLRLNKTSFLPLIELKTGILKSIFLRESSSALAMDSEIQAPVMILAGGFGKRLRPLTDNIPKPMLHINGIPMLEIIISNLTNFGFKKFFLSTFYMSEFIQDYFEDGSSRGIEITYLKEDEPRGTAGSLSMIPRELDFEDILIMNADILSNLNFREFLEYHKTGRYDFSVATAFHNYQIPYGVIKSKSGKISSIHEKPRHSENISAGIYIAKKTAIDCYVNKNGYQDMPELINSLIKDQKNLGSFPIHEYWLDIGKKEDFVKAQTDVKIYFDV